MRDRVTERGGKTGDAGLRVLIVRIGAMGDVLHALPAVAGLRQAFPDCRIGWAIEPRWAALLAPGGSNGPVVDRLHMVKTSEWKRRPMTFATGGEISSLRRELRAEDYDLCVDLQGSMKSAAVGKLAGGKAVYGYG